jgi:pectate lyase
VVLLPLAGRVGKPVVKGTFDKGLDESVVKFPAPVKGRYFRLRALSEASGTIECCGVAELTLHCEGVTFRARPWSLRVDYPDVAEDVIALIEGFPLLARLLELSDPWSWDATALKDQLFPEGTEPFPGTGADPVLFVNRRTAHDWRVVDWKTAGEKHTADQPGLKVWDHHAFETDYYALPSASPFIRLHMGRPVLDNVDSMKLLFPELPTSVRKESIADMDRIVEALKPYGGQKLPAGHKNQPYLLPGGTRMTICDFTVDPPPGQVGDYDEVRIKIDFEPATPLKGRETLPLFAAWRRNRRKDEPGGSPGILAHLQTSAAGPAVPATGEAAARQWADRPTGFASVDAMGQNGTIGGAGGKVVTVTTQEELEKYAQAKEPYIIRVQGEIRITEKENPRTRYEKLTTKEIHIASDKTIVGVGKSGHIVNGGFFIGPGTHNVILRNLTIRDTFVDGDWWGATQDYDGLQMDSAHHVWVDHCHFSRHGDGCLDSRAGTTYLTISWCIFSHHNKTMGVGWDSKVTAQITLHHTWFRNTSCRSPSAGQVLRAHYYNNYLQTIEACSHRALFGANLMVHNSFFANVNGPLVADDKSVTIVDPGSVYHGILGPKVTCGRAFFDPGRFYAYTLDKAEDIPGLLTKYAGPQENIGQQE